MKKTRKRSRKESRKKRGGRQDPEKRLVPLERPESVQRRRLLEYDEQKYGIRMGGGKKSKFKKSTRKGSRKKRGGHPVAFTGQVMEEGEGGEDGYYRGKLYERAAGGKKSKFKKRTRKGSRKKRGGREVAFTGQMIPWDG